MARSSRTAACLGSLVRETSRTYALASQVPSKELASTAFAGRLQGAVDLATGDLHGADPKGDGHATLAAGPQCTLAGGTPSEAVDQQVQRARSVATLQLLVSPLDDDASPSTACQVLIHFETHSGVLPHHRGLLSLDGVDVGAIVVPGVNDGHNIDGVADVAAHPADHLFVQERVDLAFPHLQDHRTILACRPTFGPSAGRQPAELVGSDRDRQERQ